MRYLVVFLALFVLSSAKPKLTSDQLLDAVVRFIALKQDKSTLPPKGSTTEDSTITTPASKSSTTAASTSTTDASTTGASTPSTRNPVQTILQDRAVQSALAGFVEKGIYSFYVNRDGDICTFYDEVRDAPLFKIKCY